MSTAGYSGTPLPRKLGIRAGSRLLLVGAPPEFGALLGDLPPGVELRGAGRQGGRRRRPLRPRPRIVARAVRSAGRLRCSPRAVSGSPGPSAARESRPISARTRSASSAWPRASSTTRSARSMRPGRACASSGGSATGRGARDRARRVRRTRRLRALAPCRRSPPRRVSRCPAPARPCASTPPPGRARMRRSSSTASSGRLSAHFDGASAAFLPASLAVLRVATTQVAGREVADPLPPLERRAAISGAGPVRLVLRFRVPEGTAAGSYDGRLVFAQNGQPFETLPVRLRVFAVRLPARDDRDGLPHALPDPAADLPRRRRRAQRRRVRERRAGGHGSPLRLPLRLPPEPRAIGAPGRRGPTAMPTVPGWSQASATRMSAEGRYPFRTMRLPLGTQRSAPSRTGQTARSPGDLGRLPDGSRAAVLARARLARSRARVGLGRARSGLRPPVRRAAGLRRARGRSGLSHDRCAVAAHPGAPRDDPVGAGHAQLHDPCARRGQRLPLGRSGLRRRGHLGRALAPLLRLLRRRPSSRSRAHRGAARAAGRHPHGAPAGSLDLELHLRLQVGPRLARATRPRSRRPTRACSVSGTRSRAWTARCTPTAW